MRNFMPAMAVLTLSLPFASMFSRAADGPPVAPVRVVIDDYYGTKIPDPYRYFENLADPEVQAWIKGQAAYATRVLGAIPGRDALLARIRELDEGSPYRIDVVYRWPNGDLHYLKRMASENLNKLYFRDGKTGAEQLLVDPERFAEPSSGRHYALEFCQPSPNKRYVAYGIAAAGSEQTTLHVFDATTGKDLPDVIDRMEADYVPPCWLPDSTAFTYQRRRKLPEGASATEVYKQTRSYLHRLGGDTDADPLLFAMGSSPAVAMSETDFPAVIVTTASPYAIGQIKHGDESRLTLYTAPLDSLSKPETPWRKICDLSDEVTHYALHGEEIYLLTSAKAPRFKIVRTSLKNPEMATADTIVAESAAVVQGIGVAKDALYVNLLEGAAEHIVRVPYALDAKPEPVASPASEPSAWSFGANIDTEGTLLATQGWVRGGRIYAFNRADHSLTDTGLRPPGKYDEVEGFESTEVLVPSHDGVKVPLSIVYPSGIKLDGSHPTLVTGYGAYGHTTYMHFNSSQLAWMERGGVLAYAHVRGGGEYGRDWHLGGQKATKINTWKDFLACCEYLVANGYTSPGKLAGMGGSAGGILIGRAVTERPELFAAALILVGCTDLLRMETTTNGVPNIPEFGTVTTKDGFEGLFAMSAYHHVADGVKYPAVLLVHGINDPRVEPWESAKMTARLQAASTSGKPILFRVDYDAGHGIGSTKSQRQQELADEYSFLLWQMGEPGFQPR